MGAEACVDSTDLNADASDQEIQEAYDEAVKESKWENGNGGYTGTLAESEGLVIRRDLMFYDEDSARMNIDDYANKYGPTVAVIVSGKIAFAGIYSS